MPLLMMYWLMFHWPKHILWPSLESVWRGLLHKGVVDTGRCDSLEPAV